MRDTVRVQGLRLAFGGRTLVDGLDLGLSEGGRLILTGASGCGKSTLLKCLLGFARPAAGAIEVFGSTVGPESVWDLRRQMAWVPQEPELGDGTAGESLQRMFRYRANRALERGLDRAEDLARDFLLDGAALSQPVARLSGGEKQRVALIAALLLGRPLLLLDEPFSALDPESQSAVIDHISGLSATIICVSHATVSFGGDEQVLALGPPGGRRDD